ncbi:MAG: serine hydrolase domain-containing protein [Dehalococcoidia bacterium]|nr:serine hydrolase domain-containing protein [Dehalococcoidia bacterium]
MDGSIIGQPERVGMDRGGLEQAVEHLEKLRRDGMHDGAQLFIARHGIPVLDVALGEARPGIPLKTDSVMLWFSSTKPLTAVAIAQQVERGKLELDDPVKKYIPDFGNGKETCTVRHVLKHMGGFRMVNFPFLRYDWETNIRKICEEPAEWEPGTAAGYHPLSGWNILGEIVRRVDGRPIEVYLRGEIFQPLGMEGSSLGITAEREKQLGDRLSQVTEKTMPKPPPNPWNDRRARPRILPGGNGYGPAHDLAKFYLMLWNGGEWDGYRFLKKETVALFTATHRKDVIDRTFSLQAGMDVMPPWALGFHKGFDQPMNIGFGRRATAAAYGHGGARSSIGFVEPTRDLVVTCVTNGMPTELENTRRLRDVSDFIHGAVIG